MSSRIQNFAAAGAAALLLSGTLAVPAFAYYTGYGNGDPGNWGFATEQEGGPCAGVKTRNGRMPKCCLKYTPMHFCPDMPHRTAYRVPPLAPIVQQ